MSGNSARPSSARPSSSGRRPLTAKWVPPPHLTPIDPWPNNTSLDQQIARQRISDESSAKAAIQAEQKKERLLNRVLTEERFNRQQLANHGYNSPTDHGKKLRNYFENTLREKRERERVREEAEAAEKAAAASFYRQLNNKRVVGTRVVGGYMNIAKRRLLIGIINSKNKDSSKKTKVVKRKAKANKAVKVTKPVRRRKPTIVRK